MGLPGFAGHCMRPMANLRRPFAEAGQGFFCPTGPHDFGCATTADKPAPMTAKGAGNLRADVPNAEDDRLRSTDDRRSSGASWRQGGSVVASQKGGHDRGFGRAWGQCDLR